MDQAAPDTGVSSALRFSRGRPCPTAIDILTQRDQSPDACGAPILGIKRAMVWRTTEDHGVPSRDRNYSENYGEADRELHFASRVCAALLARLARR